MERSGRGGGAPAARGAGGPTSRGSGAAPEELQGVVEVVTFHAEDSGYTVLRIYPDNGYGDPDDLVAGRVTAVGDMTTPAEGLHLRLVGAWTTHRSHGRQFRFDTAEVLEPADRKGLVKYLASKSFRGIGEKTAERARSSSPSIILRCGPSLYRRTSKLLSPCFVAVENRYRLPSSDGTA